MVEEGICVEYFSQLSYKLFESAISLLPTPQRKKITQVYLGQKKGRMKTSVHLNGISEYGSPISRPRHSVPSSLIHITTGQIIIQ